MLISSRDFVYVRQAFGGGGEYWVVSTSLPGAEDYAGCVRGRIVVGVTRAVEVEGGVRVSTYSEVDMKIQLKPEATKAKGVL